MQEDLAAAEAELAGWYETMQRETHALKRIYQHQPNHDLLDHGVLANSPAAEGAADTEVLHVPDWLKKVESKPKMTNAEKGNRVAARQLPQVHRLVKACNEQSSWETYLMLDVYVHPHVCVTVFMCAKLCLTNMKIVAVMVAACLLVAEQALDLQLWSM